MRRILLFITVLTLATTGATLTGSPAGAVDCASVTVAPGDRLLANKAPVGGPYSIDLPAGEYRLVVSSTDSHHADGALTQEYEIWYFTLDSGFTSPVTPDLPDELVTLQFDLGVFTIAASTSITFHHGVQGPGAQSVTPAVQFVCAQTPDTTVPETTAPETTAPETTAPETTAPETTAPDTTAPDTTAPDASAAPTTAPVDSQPPGSVLPSPSIVNPTTTEAPTTDQPTTTAKRGEVLPIVITPDEPGGDLARTGGDLDILWIAVLLLGAGVLATAVGKVIAPTKP